MADTGHLLTQKSELVKQYITYDVNSRPEYVDTGVAIQAVGASTRYEEDTSWNGTDTSKAITVTTLNMDARKAIWQLKDNTNNYETVYGKITATSATAVTIAVNTPLPAGSYRLVGIQ